VYPDSRGFVFTDRYVCKYYSIRRVIMCQDELEQGYKEYTKLKETSPDVVTCYEGQEEILPDFAPYETGKLADEVREALPKHDDNAHYKGMPDFTILSAGQNIKIPKRTNSVVCDVCHKKKIAGRHIETCKKAHKVKWFLRKFRR